MTVELTYIGHSAFHIQNDEVGILIDPFMSQNPMAKFDFTNKKLDYILVTHAHTDHLGDSVAISKKSGAKIFAIYELADICNKLGGSAIGANMGGKIKFPFGSITFLPAFHSSSTDDGKYAGEATSILLEIGGLKFYHAGDTSLTQEFKMIGEFYQPDVVMLPIGGFFTMGIDESVVAAKWLNAKKVMPMHYNTFSVINVDVNDFKNKIENQGQICLVPASGETVKFDV